MCNAHSIIDDADWQKSAHSVINDALRTYLHVLCDELLFASNKMLYLKNPTILGKCMANSKILKTLEVLEMSRYGNKHKIKVPFNKRSVTLTNLRRLLCSVRRIPGLVFAVADAHRDGTHTEEQVESIYEGIRQDD